VESDKGQNSEGKLVDIQLQQTNAFYFPSREAGEFQDAIGTLTGTDTLRIWQTNKLESPTLRGGYMSMVVSAALRSSDYGHLVIEDARGNLLMPLSPYCADTPAGFVFRTEGNVMRFDLLEGNTGKVDDQGAGTRYGDLFLACTTDIGAGVINVASVCWGAAST
jgi:hypothetical protein